MSKVQAIPDGFNTITPHMVVKSTGKAVDFYKKAFGAEEICRHNGPDGKVMHSQIRIGNSSVMLNDEYPEHGVTAPDEGKPTSVTIHLYVEDVDNLYQRAVDAGAEVLMPLSDAFWGDRYAMLKDPFGHRWSMATHKEDVPEGEMAERARKAFADGNC